ncbi:MAG: TatD family hydrolase [Thaumarchaeota archaeon]|nr:TatD family hydrolase [Nitrososphaerota archaeon]MDD9812772.1 TatD family hydrolase [Nitrososphaerota archaeon]RNJ74116.1 MAG: TatD family deoxyribonuclease [Thaumarchaeota archaeon S14]
MAAAAGPEARGASLYDTHVHLADAAYAPMGPAVLAAMEALDIAAACVSTTEADSALAVAMAARFPRVLAFVGVHPDGAGGGTGGIGRLVEAGGVSGIGEVGLDPTVTDEAGYARQRAEFGGLLEIAERHGLPVSVHSRKSADDVMDMLSSYGVRAALHWFDGNRRQLARALDMGAYVAYGPVSVYAADKRSLIARTDPSLILAETDGPVRFSRCFGGMPAQPCHVPSVALCMARARGVPYGEMREALAANSRRWLGI